MNQPTKDALREQLALAADEKIRLITEHETTLALAEWDARPYPRSGPSPWRVREVAPLAFALGCVLGAVL